jgi:hypothetical protein
MSKPSRAGKVSIYISADPLSIRKHVNPNDPSPLYCRQLSIEFQRYLDISAETVYRDTQPRYIFFYRNAVDKGFQANALMKAIRFHYNKKKKAAEDRFIKFKKKNFLLLGISFSVVIICQWILSFFVQGEKNIHAEFSNVLDVFSWVILWKPIERLVFHWNPFLKDILLYKKMAAAEMLLVAGEQELSFQSMEQADAA